MKLGILVNTDKHLDAIEGLTRAAVAKGHEVTIFAMDEGTRLLKNTSYTELCRLQGVTMCFCDYSATTLCAGTENLSDKIQPGSQYNNAIMCHNADKVIVL